MAASRMHRVEFNQDEPADRLTGCSAGRRQGVLHSAAAALLLLQPMLQKKLSSATQPEFDGEAAYVGCRVGLVCIRKIFWTHSYAHSRGVLSTRIELRVDCYAGCGFAPSRDAAMPFGPYT